MNGRHVRVGHVGDEADAGGKKAGVLLGARNRAGELLAEASADGRVVDPDLLEHPADHLAANTATAGFAVRVRAVPRNELERRVAAGLTLDRLEGSADAVAKRFELVARGLLLII